MPSDRTWPKLKDCPFCGEEQAPDEPGESYVSRETSKWGAVECRACGALGPEVRTGYGPPIEWAADAAEEWNRRAE